MIEERERDFLTHLQLHFLDEGRAHQDLKGPAAGAKRERMREKETIHNKRHPLSK